MPSRRSEIQVGLALVLALVVLVVGLSWFESYQLGASYQQVRVTFESVGGLGAGDPVEVRGISMGKVTKVALDPIGVSVELRLHGDVVLHDNAVFTLGSAGIMGERMVSVEPGSGTRVDPATHSFEGVYQAASTELVGQFEDFNARIMEFLDHADSVLIQLQRDKLLVRALESTADAATTAAQVLGDNREDLARASKAMADLSVRFSTFMEEHEEDLSAGAKGLARATDSLDSLSSQMQTVLAGTQDVITALKEQRGAAGKMIYDEEAGENLVQSLEQLRFLVEDLQRNPQRYLTVKIF